jgi:hypothetical protein
MKEAFKDRTFRGESLAVIDLVNQILEEYAAQGYTLTLRQAYYQLVARGHVPNSLESYKRIGDIVSEGRLAGLIDWDHIEDRARETVTPNTWANAGSLARAAAEQFRTDHWGDQPCHVEILVEKQALEGVLLPVADRLGVPFTANKGYLSQSMVYQIAQRLTEAADGGQEIRLFYLGDHDPSGLDMDRDIADRLRLFTRGYVDFEITRLALLMRQIEIYAPPENPAKITDSRAAAYIEKHGASSWELDALEPRVLVGLVEQAITDLIEEDAWDVAEERQRKGREQLRAFASRVEKGK